MTTVRPLHRDDLPRCGFAGTPTHLRYVAGELDRADRGEVDYLVVLDDRGAPVAVGGVDHVERAPVSCLYQLATAADRRSQGFGTLLVRALEDAAATRGATRVGLGVEDDNVRATALYERLGYRVTGEVEQAGWDSEDAAGVVTPYRARVVRMERALPPARPGGAGSAAPAGSR